MGVSDRLFGLLRDMVVLGEKVEQLDGKNEALGQRVECLVEVTTDLDRRLIRLETMVELAERLRLPGNS